MTEAPIPDPDVAELWFCPYCVKFDGSRRTVLEHMPNCSKAPGDEEEQ